MSDMVWEKEERERLRAAALRTAHPAMIGWPYGHDPVELALAAAEVENCLEPSDYEAALKHRNYWRARALDAERQIAAAPYSEIEQCVLDALRSTPPHGAELATVLEWMADMRRAMTEVGQ